jgi:hypothetical protein
MTDGTEHPPIIGKLINYQCSRQVLVVELESMEPVITTFSHVDGCVRGFAGIV